jgi:hypothetical protein
MRALACLIVVLAVLGCSSEDCAPVDEPDAPEGNTLYIRLADYAFSPGAYRIELESEGHSIECEVEVGPDPEQGSCSDNTTFAADDGKIQGILFEGYSPREVTVSLYRDGTLEATEHYTPSYDRMGHCGTAVHAVVDFPAT